MSKLKKLLQGEAIKPGLLSYEIDEQWQEEGQGSFGSQAEVRWVVHYEVKLFDFISQQKFKESTKWEQFKARHGLSDRFNKDSALGELFGFTVCSPAFQEFPTEDYVQDTDRFLVQQKFNEDEAISYLRSRLDAIGEKGVDIIGEDFQKFLDTEEWDREG